MDVLARGCLEMSFASDPSSIELLFYVDYERYDESSMPIWTNQSEDAPGGLLSVGGELASTSSASTSLALRQVRLAQGPEKQGGPTKLVQGASSFGMLVRRKGQGTSASQTFIILGDSLTDLQACDRTTAEVFRFMAHQRSQCSLGARAFKCHVRMVTVDHYAANLKAERALKYDRDWLSLVIGCEARTVAGIHTKVMQLVDYDICGAINLSCSVLIAGFMGKFRACLKTVVKSRLLWPPCPPCGGILPDQLLCTGCVALTIGWSRSSVMQRRALLRLLPCGDWRKHDVVETYVHPMAELPDRESYAEDIANSLTQGLAWHKFLVYPRHRWLGCEAAISQPTLLAACHGLLEPTVSLFCATVGKVRKVLTFGVW